MYAMEVIVKNKINQLMMVNVMCEVYYDKWKGFIRRY